MALDMAAIRKKKQLEKEKQKNKEALQKEDKEQEEKQKKEHEKKDAPQVEPSLSKTEKFDKNHAPSYSREWKGKKCPQRDDLQIRKIFEKSTTNLIKDLSKLPEKERTDWNRYRVVLIKDGKDKVQDIIGKTAKDFEKDREEGKRIPEIALVSPSGEIKDAPIPVDRYLKYIGKETLAHCTREDRVTPIIESVYNKSKNGLEFTYDSTYDKKTLEKHKDLANEIKKKTKDLLHGQDKKTTTIEKTAAEREAERASKNDELIDKDKWEFGDAGVNRDVTLISDEKNMHTQLSHKIAQTYEAEQERLDDIENHQEVPAATQEAIGGDDVTHESPYRINRQPGDGEATWKTYEQEQYQDYKAEEAVWSAKDFEDINMNGIPDEYEEQYYEGRNGNGIPDNQEKGLSWREQIELQDEEYWNGEMERTYGA